MLAERARLPLAIVLLSGAAALALALAPRSPHCTRHTRTVAPAADPAAVARLDGCPAHIRAAIHLDHDASLFCIRGQFPDPGTFVFAKYRTTEAWERFAVVGDDGHLIVPMLDRPAR